MVGRQLLTVGADGIATCADGAELSEGTIDVLQRHPNWCLVERQPEPEPEPEPETESGDGDQALPSPDEILASREEGETYKDVSATLDDLTGGLDHGRGWDAMIEAYTEWYEANA